MFGPDDPRTLTAVECLAAAHLLLGHAGEAIRLGREVAAARKRVLGAAHPDTLAARLGVGLAYAEARAESQAIAVLTSALQDAEAAHGVHRLTIEIRAALACCHAVTGESTTAAAEYERAVADATALLGADDPVTAALREEAGELGGARTVVGGSDGLARGCRAPLELVLPFGAAAAEQREPRQAVDGQPDVLEHVEQLVHVRPDLVQLGTAPA